MNRDIKNIFKILKETAVLEKTRKAQIKESLLTYMKGNPVRNEAYSRPKSKQSNYFDFIYKLKLVKPMPIILSLILLTTVGFGGISTAAEKSLPGDKLYSIKTEVNEKIRSALSLSSESRAEFEIEKAARRLKEAEILALKGQLDNKVIAKVESKFQEHTKAISFITQTLEQKGKTESAAELRSKLGATLDAHDHLLVEVKSGSMNSQDAKELVQKIANEVKDAIQNNAELSVKIEAKIRSGSASSTQSSAQSKLKAATNKLEEVESYISKKYDRVSPETKLKIEAQIKGAKNAINEGELRIESGKYGEAFLLLQKAMRLAQQAKIMVQAHVELDFHGHKPNTTSTSHGDDDNDDDDNDNDDDRNNNDNDDYDDYDDDDYDYDDDDNATSTESELKLKIKIKGDADGNKTDGKIELEL